MLRWRLWEPTARRFVPRRLSIDVQAEEAQEADDEVPWSRPHWSQWSTSDLIRWCDQRHVDLSGCFDRDAVLDRVLQSVEEATDGAGEAGEVVRLCSRVKTDGSYTRPPTLDRRSSSYGNRVERFEGLEEDVLPWLYSSGDKSRLYGVYFGKESAGLR